MVEVRATEAYPESLDVCGLGRPPSRPGIRIFCVSGSVPLENVIWVVIVVIVALLFRNLLASEGCLGGLIAPRVAERDSALTVLLS